MAQFLQKDEPCLTPKQVQITLGTFLTDCLGTYTFKNGHTRKAIAINKRDDNVKVSGLELVLKPVPTNIDRMQRWGFFLVQHDSGSQALYYATQMINTLIRRGGFSRVINQNYELKQFLQVYVEVPVGELYSLRVQLGL